MKTLNVIILSLLFVVGCSRSVIPVKSETDRRKTERIIDTVTKVVPDSALIRALLECDSLGQVHIRDLYTENGRLVKLNMELRDNLLRLRAQVESQERVREVIRTDTIYEYIEVPVVVKDPVVEYRLRWWQKWLLWIGVFYLVRIGVKVFLNWKQITFKNLLKIF